MFKLLLEYIFIYNNMIHTFGDSHADGGHSHWGYIRLPNINIKTNHLGPKLMYTLVNSVTMY